MKLRVILFAFVLLMFAVQSCSGTGGQVAENAPNLAATRSAQAPGPQNPPVSNAVLATPAAGENDLAASPVVKVRLNTNCSSGPSTSYDLIFSMNPGPAVPIIGKDTADNYWVINNPVGGTCWLSGKNAIVKGDTSLLPEVPPPPTPTAQPSTAMPAAVPTGTTAAADSSSAPADPATLNVRRTCAAGLDGQTPVWVEDLILTWQDNALNEDGFHVFQNNTQLTALPQDSTRYHFQFRYNQGTGGIAIDKFAVEAFNGAGASSRPMIDVPRCH